MPRVPAHERTAVVKRLRSRLARRLIRVATRVDRDEVSRFVEIGGDLMQRYQERLDELVRDPFGSPCLHQEDPYCGPVCELPSGHEGPHQAVQYGQPRSWDGPHWADRS